jgi:hypothetical protein
MSFICKTYDIWLGGLLGLLNWNGAEENLIDILKRFMFVDVIEVMKVSVAFYFKVILYIFHAGLDSIFQILIVIQ